MIIAKVKIQDSCYKRFECSGHAEYAEKGQDVICAAVSTLVINTANCIEQFCDCKFKSSMNNNVIVFEFSDTPDDKAKLLMDAMVFGLKNIQKEYGKKYLRLEI